MGRNGFGLHVVVAEAVASAVVDAVSVLVVAAAGFGAACPVNRPCSFWTWAASNSAAVVLALVSFA